MSAGVDPVLMSSTQSPGTPALDSTSFMRTPVIGPPQSFVAPLVTLLVVMNSPVPLGQRPYVVVAWLVQLKESTGMFDASDKRALSALPSSLHNAVSI